MKLSWRAQAPLAVAAGVQVGLSAAFITYFSWSFDYGERLIALHVSVVAAGIAGVTLAAGLAVRLTRAAVVRRAARLVPSLLFPLLVLLYVADVLSNRGWGHNITYDLVARYLARPGAVMRYAGFALDAATTAAVLAVALAGALTLARSRSFGRHLESIFARPDGRAGVAPKRAAAVAVAGTVAVAIGVVLLGTVSRAPRDNLLRRDPLLGFVFDTRSIHGLAISRYERRSREDGPAARAAWSAPAGFDRRNVILVVADSLRPDHTPLYGYDRPTMPFLGRLAESGRLRQVELALATCPDSHCAISSVLASRTFGSLAPENFTLDELLGDAGYDVRFILSGDHDWLGLRQFYGSGMTSYFDGLDSRHYDPTDDRVVFEGLDTVPDYEGRPTFFYFHLMSSHQLGYRLPQYAIHQPARTFLAPDGDVSSYVNYYDNGVTQADAMIEQLFSALDRKGYLADALVVILADHGEGLGTRPGYRGRGHGTLIYQDVLSIPLFFYDDPTVSYGNLEFATQVDVAPTIAARLGLPIPATWEGRSLLDAGIKPFSVHHDDGDTQPVYAIVRPAGAGTYKYLKEAAREELFELHSDPQERHNLIGSADPVIVDTMRRTLDAVVYGPADPEATGVTTARHTRSVP